MLLDFTSNSYLHKIVADLDTLVGPDTNKVPTLNYHSV